jgi:uncharacterized repeat protein (TIGR03847 family)
MASVIHSFDPPERFVAGTVGPPGQRTFFLQARTGPRVTSVALEKQQVSVLAERIDELLDELLRSQQGAEGTIPAVPPVSLQDNGPLEQPIVEEFRAGTMTLSWDPADQRVVVEVFPLTDESVVEPGTPEEEIEEPEPEEVLLVRLPPGVARAFSARAQAVVSAGREPCPFCGAPLDPSGHLCPRANGFRRTAAQPEE